MYLEQINQAGDIKKLKGEELTALAQEIREFLIEKISNTGGHLASNLGVVELTMALHLTFNLPEDKIVWDVGHQAYTHKLLTGRREGFDTLRKYGGMSGFPKRKESDCDAFDTGHSSTSISAGLGLVRAREILGGDNYVISVIGDGSLTGGMAYEAMNNAARLKSNFIIVLNDNNMSISENVGGMSNYLGSLRTADGYLNLKTAVTDSLNRVPVYGEKIVSRIRKTKNGLKQLFIPGMLFENMGLTYLGPVDGHNIGQVMRALEEAKSSKQAEFDKAADELDSYLKSLIAQTQKNYANAPISCSLNFICPLPSYKYISCQYGSGGHKGVDFAAPGGTNIRAVAGGVVTVSGWHYSYGNYVMIYHGTDDQGNTYATLYAHMNSTPPVSVGQSVSQGDVIGYVGTTGNSTGNHLHLELRVNGARTNPLNYVPH